MAKDIGMIEAMELVSNDTARRKGGNTSEEVIKALIEAHGNMYSLIKAIGKTAERKGGSQGWPKKPI